MSDLVRTVQQMIDRARRQFSTFLRRGEVSLATGEGYLQVQGYADEQLDDVPLMQQYGFASWPPSGSDVLTVHLGGRSEEAVAIGCDSNDDRPEDLTDGEAVAYGKKVAGGQAQARLKPDGTLSLVCATAKFVEVGGNTDRAIKGDAFNAALNTFLSALTSFVAAGGGAPGAPFPGGPALAAAITTFAGQLSGLLATKTKVG